MVPSGIFEIRISGIFCLKFGFHIHYIINLGIQHKKIWKFYIQSKYLPSYITKYILIRKRNAKILKPHFLEKDHFDGISSDMANEELQ